MTLRKFFFGSAGTGSQAGDFGLLLLRLGAGLALAFAHGMGKLPPAERFISGIQEMGFPAPAAFAWAASLSEFAGGLLVAIGLATRPAALFALVTMSVAFFIRHGADDFSTKEKAFLFGIVFLAIAFTGAGRYSVDAMIRPK